MPEAPAASIIIPTRSRSSYLDVTLGSVMPQASGAGAEVIVVSDGIDAETAAVAERHGATLLSLDRPRGANAARNAGIRAARADLLVLIDDDVMAPPGWLGAILTGARSAPDHDVFGGPIRARLEGGGPRSCGRESAPITTLDLGPEDRDAPLVWSANMALRRSALSRAGDFDETFAVRGDEEEWEHRYLARGGRIRYLSAAGLDHRRATKDATLRALARAAYFQGRAARRYDARRAQTPTLRAELRVLVGCLWHTARRRCANGIVMAAHTAGRIHEALVEHRAAPASEDFLSGTSGEVSGFRATTRALVADTAADAYALAHLRPWRLRQAAAAWPCRRVLALGVEREDRPNLLAEARRELERSRHNLRFASCPVGNRGKFENLNMLLQGRDMGQYEWLLVIDDDVALPRGFLDTFLFLAERFELRLAQPAHRGRSHAGWQITRQRVQSVARETAYVEIGPVVAFHATTFDTLLPFPELKAGWGLDLHWSAVARQHGWRIGVVDATPIRHGVRVIASSYDRSDAIAEARDFLAERPYIKAQDAQKTLADHRSWR